jgi:hypothetical protein
MYATDKCRKERPAMLPLATGRTVACHYPLNVSISPHRP